MARSHRRPPPEPVVPRFERLLQSIGDLVQDGPTDALYNALTEVDHAITLAGEALGQDPEAAQRLEEMRLRLAEVTGRFELEQRRIGRDLISVQAEIQGRARYAPPAAVASRLDRRG